MRAKQKGLFCKCLYSAWGTGAAFLMPSRPLMGLVSHTGMMVSTCKDYMRY